MRSSAVQRAGAAVSWAGGAAFAASLGYFLYSYLVSFGTPAEGSARVRAVMWNVTVFSVFALHHSLFARPAVRAAVARIAPDHERSVYVWVASLLLAATCFLWRPVPGIAWDAPPPFAWLLRGLQIAGVWLSLRSAAIIDVWALSGITPAGGLGAPVTEFRVVGPYAWVRHPIYLGWFLLVFAVPTMTMTQLVFAAVSSAYVLIAIPLEERSLLRTSGAAYRRYQEQVPWKLVPRVF